MMERILGAAVAGEGAVSFRSRLWKRLEEAEEKE